MQRLYSGSLIDVLLLVLLKFVLGLLVRNVASIHKPATLVSTEHDYSKYFIGIISQTLLLPTLWFHEKYESECV